MNEVADFHISKPFLRIPIELLVFLDSTVRKTGEGVTSKIPVWILTLGTNCPRSAFQNFWFWREMKDYKERNDLSLFSQSVCSIPFLISLFSLCLSFHRLWEQNSCPLAWNQTTSSGKWRHFFTNFQLTSEWLNHHSCGLGHMSLHHPSLPYPKFSCLCVLVHNMGNDISDFEQISECWPWSRKAEAKVDRTEGEQKSRTRDFLCCQF